MIFVDTNIPMYLVGASRPHKLDAQRIVESALAAGERLVTDAEVLQGAVKDSSELGDIRWVRLDEAQKLPLPTITGLILGEVGRLIREPPAPGVPRKIPLFKTIHRKHMLLEE